MIFDLWSLVNHTSFSHTQHAVQHSKTVRTHSAWAARNQDDKELRGLGLLLSQLCGTRAHFSSLGNSSTCTSCFWGSRACSHVILQTSPSSRNPFGFFLLSIWRFFLYRDLIAVTSRRENNLIVGLSQEYEVYISFCGGRQLNRRTWSQSCVYWLIQDCLLPCSCHSPKFTVKFVGFYSSLITWPNSTVAPSSRLQNYKLKVYGLVCGGIFLTCLGYQCKL